MSLLSIKQLSASSGSIVNDADYVNYAIKELGIPSEMTISLTKLCNPSLSVIEGCYLINEIGAVDRYNNLKKSKRDLHFLQYWSNITEIGSIFQIYDIEILKEIADGMCRGWNAALIHAKANVIFSVIVEKKENEVFILNQ